MKLHRWARPLTVAALLAGPATLDAQDVSDLDLESLLNVEVSSASKFSQRVADAPSAVTVITAEDIRRMGTADLGDALRMVPGLNLRQRTRGSYVTSLRNDMMTMSPKVLVLIDGRATMFEINTVTLWETLEVTLDQVDRIEVVRGPGSALYGANAYDGVINIITKRPSGEAEVLASGGAAEFGRQQGAVVYRQSFGAIRVDGFMDAHRSGVEKPLGEPLSRDSLISHDDAGGFQKGGVRLGWSNPEGVDVEIAAGASTGESLFYWTISPNNFERNRGTNYFTSASYTHPAIFSDARLSARFVHSARQFSGRSFNMPGSDAGIETSTQDLEVTLDKVIGSHRLVAGVAGKRYWHGEAKLFQSANDQLLYGAFLQDSWSIGSRWELTAGVRYDQHPFTGGNVSPRSTLLFKPSLDHTFRASAGRAFRSPTLLENYVDFPFQYTVEFNGQTYVIDAKVNGNPELRPEGITSYELGYIGNLHPRVAVTSDLFFNVHDGRMDVQRSKMQGMFPVEWQYKNRYDSQAYGAEIGLAVSPTDWLRSSVNYAYTKFEMTKDSEELKSPEELGGRLGASPEYKINAEIAVRPLSSLWLDVTYHHASETDEYWYITSGVERFLDSTKLPSKGIFNAHARWNAWGGLTASLYVQNLLDERYQDFLFAEELGRRAMVKASYAF